MKGTKAFDKFSNSCEKIDKQTKKLSLDRKLAFLYLELEFCVLQAPASPHCKKEI